MRRFFIVLVLGSFAVYACAEATDGLVSPTIDGGSSDDGGSSKQDAASTSSGSSSPIGDATTSSSSMILINEISAGHEWIEIVNASGTAADLGGWKVADRDKNTGEPKLADAVTFPQGTTLPATAYGMVRGGGVDGGKKCPDGGQAFCIPAEFGISNKSGETIFLIASDGGVVGSVVYPPDGAAGESTWGRIPSGDQQGTFEINTATPGAPNQAQ